LYLYPSTTTKELIDNIVKSPIFHNYFDIPIQHIDDTMLKMMKRGFGEEKTKELLDYIKAQPDAFIRTSFIVGHPRETIEMFEKMCAYAASFGFDRINVFAYSDEEGTDAYEIDEKIDEHIIAKRAEILGAIAKEAMEASLAKEVGKETQIVIDKESEEHEAFLSARKLSWAPEIDGEILVNDKTADGELHFGVIYDAKITDKVGDLLTATVYND
jgi:tRNA A37 methylthiotransferase MiaB